MCHTVAQIRRQERPMCLAEVIVRPLTMRLLDPWAFHRPHRLTVAVTPAAATPLACKVVAGMQRLFISIGGCRLCLIAVLGGGGTTNSERKVLSSTCTTRHDLWRQIKCSNQRAPPTRESKAV